MSINNLSGVWETNQFNSGSTIHEREAGCRRFLRAAKAGLSIRSGRRIEKGKHQPQRGRPHDWRTRSDPLLEVWESELVPPSTPISTA
jgi:hypothetical protein